MSTKPIPYSCILLGRILADLPSLECNDFHHSPADYHEGFGCPVKTRFDLTISLARAYMKTAQEAMKREDLL